MQHPHRLPVCAACLASVPGLQLPGCRQCGKAFPGAESSADGRCSSCQAQPPAYSTAICAAAYRDSGRALIHLLKFAGVVPAAEYWARRLAAAAHRLPHLPEVVVPVPLGRRRRRERGFNQSGEIARRLARRLGCAYAGQAMARVRETLPQSGLPRPAREANLAGAFCARPRQVAGKRVLLVDDVLTTGATARAAAAALRRAGAVEVMLAAAARADLLADLLPAEPGL